MSRFFIRDFHGFHRIRYRCGDALSPLWAKKLGKNVLSLFSLFMITMTEWMVKSVVMPIAFPSLGVLRFFLHTSLLVDKRTQRKMLVQTCMWALMPGSSSPPLTAYISNGCIIVTDLD